MDLLGKRRIAQLEEALDDKERLLNIQQIGWKNSEAQNTKLVRDLREMDQLVFQMSQATTPDQLRSAVQRAWAITETRMRTESNRIADLLIPEIKKVYANHETPPQAPTRQTPRLARSEHAGHRQIGKGNRSSEDGA